MIMSTKHQLININGKYQRNKHQKSNFLVFRWYDQYKKIHSNLLKIDKKSYKDIDIYYIGYITIKNFCDCKNIYGVNPLYLIIHFATGHFKEKNDKKYLILDSTDKYKEVWSGIRSEIKTIDNGKELFYEKNHARIRINTDDDLPLNKPLKFQAIIIWCVF